MSFGHRSPVQESVFWMATEQGYKHRYMQDFYYLLKTVSPEKFLQFPALYFEPHKQQDLE